MNNPFTPSTKYPPVCYDADPAVYHSLGKSVGRGKPEFVMSRSELRRFDENPWKWIRSGGKVTVTPEMEWGSLVDCLALTPHLFSGQYAITPETYPAKGKTKDAPIEQKPWNRNADYCKEWELNAERSGKTALKPSTHSAAKEAVDRLHRDEFIGRLIEGSDKQVQVVVEYKDKATDLIVHVKCLLDIVPKAEDSEYGRLLADLKTLQNAGVEAWEKKVFYDGLHVQAALYLDAYNAAAGDKRDGFLHPIQESEAPYAVARRMLSDEFIQMGRETYKAALKRYCACLASDRWPSYDDEDNKPGCPLIDGWRIANPSAWMIA